MSHRKQLIQKKAFDVKKKLLLIFLYYLQSIWQNKTIRKAHNIKLIYSLIQLESSSTTKNIENCCVPVDENSYWIHPSLA